MTNPIDHPDPIIRFIMKTKKDRGFTDDDFSKMCGYHRNTIAAIRSRTHSTRLGTVEDMLGALGFSLVVVDRLGNEVKIPAREQGPSRGRRMRDRRPQLNNHQETEQ